MSQVVEVRDCITKGWHLSRVWKNIVFSRYVAEGGREMPVQENSLNKVTEISKRTAHSENGEFCIARAM